MSSGRAAFISTKYLFALFAFVAYGAGARAQSWPENPGSFLEPNRFAVVGELGGEHLWLEAGFGRDVISQPTFAIGIEGLIWSRLRNLSGFRFPVETADYFFGLYTTFDALGAKHRFRISHISAHLVDGADSIVGGSSSRFSKEFVSLERAYRFSIWDRPVFGAVGLRYLFHQVTEIENMLQVPASMNLGLIAWGRPSSNSSYCGGMLLATASIDAGPSWFASSAGLTSRFSFGRSASLDLYVRYYSGLSRAGVEGKRKEKQVEIGLKVIPFESFE